MRKLPVVLTSIFLAALVAVWWLRPVDHESGAS
jgi:hypothetical protein